MINWKDFLYFPKGDKIAIILLMVLIFICGSIYIYISKFSSIDPDQLYQNEIAQQGFVEFQEKMTPFAEEEFPKDIHQTTPTTASTKAKNKLAEGKVIDANSANAKQLVQIPGIGNTLAERIVEYRDQLGGFATLDQLQEIKGITITRFSNMLPYLTLKKKHKTISVHETSLPELLSHPYISSSQAQAIIALRETANPVSLDHLIENDNFTPRDIDRLSSYLSFE